MKKMAFVDLTNYYDWPVGGMIRYEQQILAVLTEFYEIDLWGVSVEKNYPAPLQIGGRSYPVHVFANVKKKRRIIPNYWKGLALAKFWKEFQKYDIIYLHTGSCAVAAALWPGTRTSLLVYHQHGLQYLDDYSLKTLLQRPFMHLAQCMTDFSFVVTGKEELRAYASGKRIEKKLVQIGSPVECHASDEPKKLIERTGNTFIYVGRLSPVKRVSMVVEAFCAFSQKRGNKFRLLIVGDGEERKKVQKLAENSGFSDNIILTGVVEKKEVELYLQQSDFYITASKGEGASVAVLEAYRAGLPVACFSVRGLREQVYDNITGAIASEETVNGLVKAMERVYEGKDSMVENCIAECKKYTPKAIGTQIMREMERRYEAK